MGSPSGHMHCGGVMSTGAALYVECGFRPRMVRLSTAGTELWWQDGMADASAQKRLGADGVGSVITTGGITVTSKGFTIGTDAAANPASPARIDWAVWS